MQRGSNGTQWKQLNQACCEAGRKFGLGFEGRGKEGAGERKFVAGRQWAAAARAAGQQWVNSLAEE